MTAYFLDSSAVVKRYVRETGSDFVDMLTDADGGNIILLAAITQVEVAAAISRKLRNRNTTEAEAENALSAFRHDLINRYLTVDITSDLLDFATSLAVKHALRGYDAVQLAAAIISNTERIASDLSSLTVVSADHELNEAASVEGLSIDNPNDR